ncbi:MAG: hypothetical protein ACRYFS_03890 [Janthinobacterium lividum]
MPSAGRVGEDLTRDLRSELVVKIAPVEVTLFEIALFSEATFSAAFAATFSAFLLEPVMHFVKATVHFY